MPSLERLLGSDHRVLGVVTAPDRPKGRGMQLFPSPVKARAIAAGLTVSQPSTLRDPEVQATLAAMGADVFVVCAYGLLLPKAVLEATRLGCVNVHFSLLPAFRGAAPVAAALLAGVPVTGVTIMQMDPGLDTGPILASVDEPIREDDDAGSLEARLAESGAELLVHVLDGLESGTVEARPQDDARASYARKVTPDDARIDWTEPAAAVVNRVRAFSPRPGAWTTIDGRRFKVWRAEVAPGVGGEAGAFEAGPDGSLRAAAGPGEGAGGVLLDVVQPEGGRRMSGREFVMGRRGAGGRFS